MSRSTIWRQNGHYENSAREGSVLVEELVDVERAGSEEFYYETIADHEMLRTTMQTVPCLL